MLETDAIRSILINHAALGRTVTYSELFQQAGVPFSRPRVRALCKILAEIDREGRANGEPELAVLVVRGRDQLPGDGWWADRNRYMGPWEGEQAAAYVAEIQRKTQRFWQEKHRT